MKLRGSTLSRHGVLLGMLLAGCLAPVARGQEMVYHLPGDTDILFSYGILTIAEDVEYAELATLGATDRLIDDLMIPVYSDLVRNATVTAAFYTVGGSNQPLMPLWVDSQVASFAGSGVNSGITEVSFSGIDVLVPDDIFWSVSFSGIDQFDPDVPSLSYFGPILSEADLVEPPGAATDPERFWYHAPGNMFWASTGLGSGNDASLAATLTANPVPEPTVPAAGWVALLLLARRRRASCFS